MLVYNPGVADGRIIDPCTSVAMYTFTAACGLLALVSRASAWGNLGHQTVGYVAQAFLAPNALSFVQSSLGSSYSQSLGVAATVRLIRRLDSGPH